MSAIGNCPWCGGEAKADPIPEWYVECTSAECMASGPFSETRDLAIAAWNRLATPGPERHLTSKEQRVMDAALRRSVTILPDGPAEVRGRIRWGNDSFGKTDRAIFIGNICAGHILDDYRRTKEGKPAWRVWVMRKDDDGEDLGWLDTEAAARAALETAVREAIGDE